MLFDSFNNYFQNTLENCFYGQTIVQRIDRESLSSGT